MFYVMKIQHFEEIKNGNLDGYTALLNYVRLDIETDPVVRVKFWQFI